MRRRRTVATALAIAGTLGAPAGHAQMAGSVGIDSVDRYRGQGADGTGAVVEATVSGDAPLGFYGALTAHYDFNEGVVTVVDGLAGWSGRFSDPAKGVGIDPAWGWDVALHRRREGDDLDFGNTEWMAGLLGPGFDARIWYASNFYGTDWHSVYFEINAAHAVGTHCQVFAHVGRLHYAAVPYNPFFTPVDHTDGRIGASWNNGHWTIRVARDAMLSGPAYGTYGQRRPAWVAGADYAF